MESSLIEFEQNFNNINFMYILYENYIICIFMKINEKFEYRWKLRENLFLPSYTPGQSKVQLTL